MLVGWLDHERHRPIAHHKSTDQSLRCAKWSSKVSSHPASELLNCLWLHGWESPGLDSIENREGTRAEAITREHSRVARKNLEQALQDRKLRRSVPGGLLIKMPVAPG